jgi:hypothetical protein
MASVCVCVFAVAVVWPRAVPARAAAGAAEADEATVSTPHGRHSR